jgi:hypothetical protein
MTPTTIDSFVLRRLTTQDLPALVGSFQDPDTSRFLGGRDWPAAMLANVRSPHACTVNQSLTTICRQAPGSASSPGTSR